MANYRVISSDNHVFELPDLWTSRAKPAFKDRVPQLVREYDGDWWYCDGHRVIGLSPGAQTGMRFEAPEKMVRTTTFDRVRRGGYVPEEHLKDMDADGVDVSIVYPTVGLLLYSIPDSGFLSEIFRGYNDWLAEFSAAEPKRLKGIAMINVDDVQEGVAELQRCARMGLAGGMITVYPPRGRDTTVPCTSRCGRRPRISIFRSACTSRPTDRAPGRILRLRTATGSAFLPGQRRSLGADVAQRHDLQRRLRALSETQGGTVEHELSGFPLPGPHRLHVHPTGPAGALSVQSGHAAQRLFPPQRVRRLPGRRHGNSRPPHHRCRQPPLGLGLPPCRVHFPAEPADHRGGSGRLHRRGEGQDRRRQRCPDLPSQPGSGVSPVAGRRRRRVLPCPGPSVLP